MSVLEIIIAVLSAFGIGCLCPCHFEKQNDEVADNGSANVCPLNPNDQGVG